MYSLAISPPVKDLVMPTYFYKRAVVIDHTQFGSDQTNYALGIAGTFPYLATLANGGNVQNASGYDVGFFADFLLHQKLGWHTNSYTAATGHIDVVVTVPLVSHTQDTVIWLAYGAPGITTYQGT